MALKQIASLASQNTLLLHFDWIQQQSKGRFSIAVLLALTLTFFYCYLFVAEGNDLVDAPIVGSKFRLLGNFRFFFDASTVQEGYDKVCGDYGKHTKVQRLTSDQFKSSMFKLAGGSILIISNKYADELRNIGEPMLSQTEAIVNVSRACTSSLLATTSN